MRLVLAIFLTAALLIPSFTWAETTLDVRQQISQKEAEIARLQAQIDQYRNELGKNQKQSKTLGAELTRLNNELGKTRLELQRLQVALEKTELDLQQTKGAIETKTQLLAKKRAELRSYLQRLYLLEQDPWEHLLLKWGNLGDYLTLLNAAEQLQGYTRQAAVEVRTVKAELEGQELSLQERQEELERFQQLRAAQAQTLAQRRQQKDTLLRETKGRETKYQQLVKLTSSQLTKLRNELYDLELLGVSAEQALRYGTAAARRQGMRPAFLIAVLEVESRLGRNVGTGNYKKDMNPNQHQAFLKLMERLGRDPDKTPVSRKPNYGWGGAMGPAQFIPTTWLAYEDEVAAITGHNPPSPWNIEDAFVAASLKLSRQGAAEQTEAGERKAAKGYIAGNPNCTKAICNYYADLVIDKATEIERALANGDTARFQTPKASVQGTVR